MKIVSIWDKHILLFLIFVGSLVGCTMNLSFTDLSTKNKLDSSAPTFTGLIDDGTFNVSIVQSPRLVWPAAADDKEVSAYEACLGTVQGACDVINWRVVGNVNEYTFTSLSLVNGSIYYPSVRALDSAGNSSQPLQGDGWIAVAPPPTITSVDDDIAGVSSTTTPTISWTSSSSLLATAAGFHYEVAIGTTAGGTNVVNWTSAALATSWSKNGLSLTLNTIYYVTVRIVDSAGVVYSSVQGNGWKYVATVTVNPTYSAAPNWNDYVKVSSPTTVCDASNDTGYYSCYHGGEMKRFNYVTAANCTNYTAADRQYVFDWACDDSGGAGNVFFYTRGFKTGKGLANLVNAASWKSNNVIVYQNFIPVAASASGAWWTNPVTELPDSPTDGVNVNLNVASTIYTVATTKYASGGYIFFPGVDKTAVVVLPSGKLVRTNSASNGTFLLANYGANFIWVEGSLESVASASDYGFFGVGAHGVVRNMKGVGFYNAIGDGNNGMTSSLFSQLMLTYNRSVGLRVKGNNNVFEYINASHNSQHGINTGDVSNNGVYRNIIVSNNGLNGLYVYGSTNNIITGVTTVNNGGSGIIETGNTSMIFQNVFAINNSVSDIYSSSTTRTTFAQVISTKTALFAVSDVKFTNNLHTTTCSVVSGSNPGLVDTTCANQGSSDATLNSTSGWGRNSLIGQITSQDVLNASNTNGTQAFTGITDWVNFDNFWRAWGRQGTFPGTGTMGQCTSGACNIWDFMLKPTDIQARNNTRTMTSDNGAFTNGGACPAAISGSVTTVSAAPSPVTFLTNAMEVLGTGGNNNGLCQANETCIYLPNFGAYQGSGDSVSNTCIFANGSAITNVKMRAYPSN